jgi:hypothetical protein
MVAMAVVIVLSLALWSPPNIAAANCDRDIRINNMLSNAVFTLIFRGVNGEINNWSDVGESLGYGATAGYLFYKSREMIGDGDESRGIATAYLASSISENATHGRHPLSHLRYGVGPMEMQWATPFAAGGNHLSFSFNAIDALGAVSLMASGQAGNFKLRNGILTGDDFGSMDPDFSGYTLNRTVVLRPEQANDQGLWHHEMIHTTQYLQYSSFGSDNFDVVDWERVDRFGLRNRIAQTGLDLSLRVEWFNSLMNTMDHSHDYQDRNRELEAARLGQDTSPMHDDSDHSCSAQVGFQFQF